MGNALETYNQALFLKINALPGTPEWLIDFGIFCAQYLIFLLPLILLLYWFAGGREERETALFAAATAFTGLCLGFLCSAVWFHPRPFMIRLGHLWIDHVADSSFPSDHGTLFFEYHTGVTGTTQLDRRHRIGTDVSAGRLGTYFSGCSFSIRHGRLTCDGRFSGAGDTTHVATQGRITALSF